MSAKVAGSSPAGATTANRSPHKIKPLNGKAYLAYLRNCVRIVASWPAWVKGAPGIPSARRAE